MEETNEGEERANESRGPLISVALFVVGQTLAAVWWASRITISLNYVEQQTQELKVALSECRLRSATYDELNRITIGINEKLADLRTRLDKLEDRR